MSALEGLGLARNSNQSWKRLPKRRSRTDLRANADCVTRNIQGFCNQLGAGFAAAPYRAPIQTANLPQPKVISRVKQIGTGHRSARPDTFKQQRKNNQRRAEPRRGAVISVLAPAQGRPSYDRELDGVIPRSPRRYHFGSTSSRACQTQCRRAGRVVAGRVGLLVEYGEVRQCAPR